MIRRLLQIFLPVLVLAGAGFGTLRLAQNAPRPPQAAVEPPPPPTVVVQSLVREDYPLLIRSQGSVQPQARTRLIAEVSGRVLEISPAFVSGGLVRKGELLLRIEQGDYLGAVKNAKANLARAEASLAEEEARGKVARRDWQQLGLNQAPELALRKPQLAREQANVLAAEAELERAQRELARTEIRAPYDALVNMRDIDLGQYISRGALLGELFDVASAEIRLPLTYDELQQLDLPRLSQAEGEQRQPVLLSRNGTATNLQWQAQLDRSERVVDASNRMTYVVARLADPYGLKQDGVFNELAFGSFVSAEIEAGQLVDVVRIPREAVRADGNVVLIDGTQQVELRPVTVVHSDDNWLYVSDGLNPGERLALTQLSGATDGMLVSVQEAASVAEQLVQGG